MVAMAYLKAVRLMASALQSFYIIHLDILMNKFAEGEIVQMSIATDFEVLFCFQRNFFDMLGEIDRSAIICFLL